MNAWLLRHLGLSRPYCFERTIAVAVALLLAMGGGIVVLAYGLANDVAAGSPAAWFFSYAGGLMALGIACAPWPRSPGDLKDRIVIAVLPARQRRTSTCPTARPGPNASRR